MKVVKAKSANSQGMRAHARKRDVYFLRRFIHERNKHACALFVSLQYPLRAEKTPILQYQNDKINTTRRKKCTFLRFFLSFGLLLPISYRGMVAILCYPTLPSQVFWEAGGRWQKSLDIPPICVNHLNPNRSLERYNATCNWKDNLLSSFIFLLHLVFRSFST